MSGGDSKLLIGGYEMEAEDQTQHLRADCSWNRQGWRWKGLDINPGSVFETAAVLLQSDIT